MRPNLVLIGLTVLVTAAAIALIATACSWDIITQGEIHDEDSETTLLEDPAEDSLESLDLIEMEVGELLEDSLPSDST